MSQFVNANGAVLLNQNYSSTEQFTGKYWLDGKKIYRTAVSGTKEPAKNILDNLGVENYIGGGGNVKCRYSNNFGFPICHHEVGYDCYWWQNTLNCGEYVISVSLYIEYTKIND